MPSKHTAPETRSTRLPRPLRRLGAPVLVQFVKFGIVGVSNTLLDVRRLHAAAEGLRRVVPGGLGDRVRRGRRQRLSAEPPLDLPRARRRCAHAGALGDRAGLRAWAQRGAALPVRARRPPGQAARPGLRDGGRDGAHVPRQPRLDLPHAPPPVAEPTATPERHGAGRARRSAQRKTASSDSPAGMRPPRPISAASSASGRSSSQFSGAGGTHRSRLDSVVLRAQPVEHAQQDRDRQQQRVEVGGAHLLPPGLLGDALKRAARVAAMVVVDLVVAAPQPLVGGHGHEQRRRRARPRGAARAARRGRPRGARSRRAPDGQVEAVAGERHLQHRAFDHLAGCRARARGGRSSPTARRPSPCRGGRARPCCARCRTRRRGCARARAGAGRRSPARARFAAPGTTSGGPRRGASAARSPGPSAEHLFLKPSSARCAPPPRSHRRPLVAGAPRGRRVPQRRQEPAGASASRRKLTVRSQEIWAASRRRSPGGWCR